MNGVTRLFIYAITTVVVGYDLCCMAFGWRTISQTIRDMDYQLGGLVRWMILALWCHWFITSWKTHNAI